MTAPTPQEITELILGRATEPVVAIVERSQRVDLRFAASTMTTNGSAVSTTTTVIAMAAHPGQADSVGIVTGVVRSAADAHELTDRAIAAARSAAPAADAVELVVATVDELFATADPQQDVAILDRVAADLGRHFRADRAVGIEYFGYAEHVVTSWWLGTSTGSRRYDSHAAGRLELTAKSHDRSRSAWVGASTTTFSDVDVDAMIEDVKRRLTWAGTSLDIEPGRHRVILPPGAVADLVVPMVWASSSRDAREGRSAFSLDEGTKLGHTIAADGITIRSDPHDPRRPVRPFTLCAGSSALASVFDNGAEIESVAWIENGVLRHLIGSRHERQINADARLSADNLLISHTSGHGTLEDVIARTDDALLITCLWYIREVDPQSMLSTGLTRDGVYRVRNGEVVGQVGNFRFNESPLSVLSHVVDAGASVVAQPREWADYVDDVVAPPLVVEQFNLSTRSDAL